MMKAIVVVAIFLCAGINAKSCSDKVKELEASPPLLGAFKPVCQPNGKYKEIQCHGSTGYCFCVNTETGEEILGTRIRGQPKSCKATTKSCSDKVKELEASPPLLGAFKPQCQPDGKYKETQCHGSTGYCFCVKPETGEEIIGTRIRGVPKSCKATPCLLQRHDVMKKGPLVGAFVPQCEEDGSFKTTQCHGSTGYCFCVNGETGEKLLGTELRFNRPQTCELTKCIKERHEALKEGLLGSFRPECEADGSYKPVQCHAGFCFCAFPETGKEILGSRLTVRGQRPTSCKPTPCMMQRHNVLNAERPLLGAFKPECNADGSFKSVQCKEGYCYCVFSNGEEILGTMGKVRGQRPKSCALTSCILSRHKGWAQAKLGLLGVPITRCNDYGKYAKVQCRKGMCWCVDPDTGKAVKGMTAQWTVPKCD